MDAFDKLLAEATNLAEAKKKAKKKAKGIVGQKVYGRSDPGQSLIKNPWQDEAVVLITTLHRCKCCGNEQTSWNSFFSVERTRVRNGAVERLVEKHTLCNMEDIYTDLPRRLEYMTVETCSCPMCFRPLPNGVDYQEQLPFLFKEQMI